MTEIPRFHDATLTSLSLDWAEGVALINLSVGPDGADTVKLMANGVVSIVCPRRFPWGPSDSINETTEEAVPEGIMLSVEMQSGDLLQIICNDVTVAAE